MSSNVILSNSFRIVEDCCGGYYGGINKYPEFEVILNTSVWSVGTGNSSTIDFSCT